MVWTRKQRYRKGSSLHIIVNSSEHSKHSPNIFASGELGRYTIYNACCMKFVKYWLRILHMSNHRLPKICYKLQCKWLDANSQASDIRDILLANGFGYAWYDQGVGNERDFLRMFEQKLKDIDINVWFSEVADMSRLRKYRILKDRFCYETYLNDNLITLYKQMLKFRGGLLELRANMGRFDLLHLMKEFVRYITLILKQNFISS